MEMVFSLVDTIENSSLSPFCFDTFIVFSLVDTKHVVAKTDRNF
jgi:hypothetical protein